MLTIKPFGAFAEIDGFVSHGLVHISQLAPRRVETVEEVVNVGDTVKVKVISVEMGENGRSKVSLSMKQVDQATGQDLGDVGGGGGGGGGGRREHKKREEGEDLTQFQFGTGQQLSALEHDDDDADAAPDAPKVKPNYEATGKLAESANKVPPPPSHAPLATHPFWCHTPFSWHTPSPAALPRRVRSTAST